ncbi:MAG: glycosyltransferase, exosortase A system-associated [Pseudomonadales bacterium]|nr:glycosyltransferase, exosortase A system-associated [Pseudomonadales bacterium]MCP5172681.1 glycosyltransferase, exosortase A system-associated [Pseudomonadales bacterium]MCP5302155.1 glycosyltransferase, exosortase A system-associated [Pseudomonadales bacterium]
MKILHILDHSIPLQSGYTFRTRNILRHQRELGWQTVHVTGLKHKADITALEEDVDGLHFYRTPGSSSPLSTMPILNQWHVVQTLANRIEEVIRKEQPDILHAHSPALNGLAALKAGRKFGVPVVYECRAFWEDAAVDHGTSKEFGLRYKLTRALETRVFKQADAVTTICEGLRKDIVQRGLLESKVTVIPNAVDIEHFSVGAEADPTLLEQLGLVNKTVLGFIGSFYAYEGIPLLLDALPEMVTANRNIRLLLVGGGPQESLIKQKIDQLGLQDYVVMTGRVPHTEVQDYYNLVDIFIYPRLSMRLTDLVTPLKPLEAMAQGKLVLASDVGGHHELIRDGSNGRLFKADCARSLAKSVADMLQCRDGWPEMRKAGRSYVENERNWRNSVSRYQQVYGGLCK